MPRASVWIRNDDWEKWQLIDNKAELISQAINRSEITVVTRKGELKTKQTIHPPADSPAIVMDAATEEASHITAKSYSGANEAVAKIKKTFCPDGHYLGTSGKCLQKGCKYA